ncbi:flavin reductase family protein [Gordonia sp. NPDC003424]
MTATTHQGSVLGGVPAADELPGIDGAQLRSVLGRFATGVVAIIGMDPKSDTPAGLAANSFTSVSLDPPLVAFCVARTSTSWPAIRTARRFTINILSGSQEQICRQLAARGTDKFRGVAWVSSPSGAPVLVDSLAWIEAEVAAEHEAGDHTIVVARVRHLHATDLEPLVFFRGRYGRVSAQPEAGDQR